MTFDAHMRASDADRERIAERLRGAAAEGRLLTDELEERLAAALRARTYGELDALVADLPLSLQRAGERQPSWLRPALGLAVAVTLALAAIAAVLFVLAGFVMMWLPWMLLMWWLLGRGLTRQERHRCRAQHCRAAIRHGAGERLRGPTRW